MIAFGAEEVSVGEQALLRTLRRYLPDVVADSLRRRALESLRLREAALHGADVVRLCAAIAKGVQLFVDPTLHEPLLRELRGIAAPTSELTTERHAIEQERDVSLVRVRARDLALETGGSALGAQRVATATSELARNIVSYAGRGWMELVPTRAARSMTIRAVDDGPGIRDVDSILAGRYRSRTGLGRGLAGVKKLSTRFELTTDATGTRIEAEVAL